MNIGCGYSQINAGRWRQSKKTSGGRWLQLTKPPSQNVLVWGLHLAAVESPGEAKLLLLTTIRGTQTILHHWPMMGAFCALPTEGSPCVELATAPMPSVRMAPDYCETQVAARRGVKGLCMQRWSLFTCMCPLLLLLLQNSSALLCAARFCRFCALAH